MNRRSELLKPFRNTRVACRGTFDVATWRSHSSLVPHATKR
jgi:hypothetical protein